MDKKQILNILAKEAAQAAKDQATATLAALSALALLCNRSKQEITFWFWIN